MISVRRARVSDAVAIGRVHVAAWRSAYPGILPEAYLTRLSPARQAAYYDAAIRGGVMVHVAVEAGEVVGFVSASRLVPPPDTRVTLPGDGEIETLYVLDDFRERGVGRRLLRAAAAALAQAGCRSAFLWVLRDNPSRWFYQRLGGVAAVEGETRVAGEAVRQLAYVWSPIERLVQARSHSG